MKHAFLAVIFSFLSLSLSLSASNVLIEAPETGTIEIVTEVLPRKSLGLTFHIPKGMNKEYRCKIVTPGNRISFCGNELFKGSEKIMASIVDNSTLMIYAMSAHHGTAIFPAVIKSKFGVKKSIKIQCTAILDANGSLIEQAQVEDKQSLHVKERQVLAARVEMMKREKCHHERDMQERSIRMKNIETKKRKIASQLTALNAKKESIRKDIADKKCSVVQICKDFKTEHKDMKFCYVCGEDAHKVCQSCKMVRYCSRECQVKNWPKHKALCRVARKRISHSVG